MDNEARPHAEMSESNQHRHVQGDVPAYRRNVLVDYILMPLALPVFGLWYALAFLCGWLASFAILPSYILAQRLYWAIPFIPHIWKKMGAPGLAVRLGFEGSYCINVITRFLTLPLRRDLPSFYIVGLPKCGTTSLAGYLNQHPALSGLAGLPYHEVLQKESHFFAGVLGRNAAHGRLLYRTFFPTIVRKWWCEVVGGVEKWMCFDACPTFGCLPYTAARIAAMTPQAKIILMVRKPSEAVFSAEVMLSNAGAPLNWTLTEEMQEQDPRKEESDRCRLLWERLEKLGPEEPLPEDLPSVFYYDLHSYMRCGRVNELLAPYLKHFPAENIKVIEFRDFIRDQEATVRDVLKFVGANPDRWQYQKLEPKMKGDYKGRRVHPSVQSWMDAYFRGSNEKLYNMLDKDLGWNRDIEKA